MMMLLPLLMACQNGDGNPKNQKDKVDDGPQPIVVTGWDEDEMIAPNSGDSQGEPSSVALEDGSVIAAWMELDGYDINVMVTRTDGYGEPWDVPFAIYKESRPYQNDPVLVQGGGYVYFLWLSVIGNASRSDIFCVDSTDGGRTWSDPVALDDGTKFNDRQWAVADSTGRLVIEWDHFISNYTDELSYAESPGGCSNLSKAEASAKGSFLSGVPVILPDGTVRTFRNQWVSNSEIQVIMGQKVNGKWKDTTVLTSDGESVEGTAVSEQEEAMERLERLEEWEENDGLRDAEQLPMPSLRHNAPKAVRDGDFDGVYSPAAQLLADGRIGLVTPVFESGKRVADIYFVRIDGDKSEIQKLNQDSGSHAQLEPWLDVDAAGALHVTWYDARNGNWQVYQANSYDNGDTWDEMVLSDDTFSAGFDDATNPYSWVGHFQGLSHTSDQVVAIFGDSRTNNISRIYADWSISDP